MILGYKRGGSFSIKDHLSPSLSFSPHTQYLAINSGEKESFQARRRRVS